MALDFPTSPSIGQLYPSPPVAGQPVYKWDGEKWAVSSSGGVIYAPFDAMAYSGMQINGGMEVSQELAAAGVTVTGKYCCDGWSLAFSGTMGLLAAQSSGSIVGGFPATLYCNTTTAQASLGAGHLAVLFTSIEGYRTARLAWGTSVAQPITICFWSDHQRAGLYSVVINAIGGTRSYATTYTQATAGVQQYNVITIPGDTTGTWAKDNTVGMQINFTMACGATYTAPSANTWVAGNYLSAPGQVNAVATMADVFRITGVIVLPGNQGPTAAQSPNVMRSFDQELQLCKRYYEKSYGYSVLPGTVGTAGNNGYVFQCAGTGSGSGSVCAMPILVGKRAIPSVTFFDAAGAAGKCSYYLVAGGGWVNGTGIFLTAASTQTLNCYVSLSGILFLGVDYVADARL